jgi:hypothetical protein
MLSTTGKRKSRRIVRLIWGDGRNTHGNGKDIISESQRGNAIRSPHRIQYVMVRSVFAALSGIVLFSVGCLQYRQPPVLAHSRLLVYVPADSSALAGIDFEKTRRSEFYMRHSDLIGKWLGRSWVGQIGLDPRNNLNSGIFCWRPNDANGLFIADGSFSAALLAPRLRDLGARREMNTDRLLYATPHGSLLFPKDNIAIFGARTSVVPNEMLTLRKGNGGVSRELTERISLIPGNDQIWAASRNGLPVPTTNLNETVRSALENVNRFVTASNLGIRLSDRVQLESELECSSDDSAIRVSDGVRALLALARMSGRDGDNKTIRDAFDTIQIERNGRIVSFRSDLDGQLADRLLAELLPSVQ